MPYATRDDVYAELGARAFKTIPRPVGPLPSSLDLDFFPNTGIIRLSGHGYATTDLVYLTATSGGSLPGGTQPLPTYYSPIPISDDLFQLAATPGGTPLTFSSLGAGWSVGIASWRRVDQALADTAAQIDECLTAEKPPIQPDATTGKYPQILIGVNARMAARKAVTSLQIENADARKAVDRLFASEGVGPNPAPGTDRWYLMVWKAGKPINVRPADESPGVPENAARVGRARKSHGWDRRTL